LRAEPAFEDVFEAQVRQVTERPDELRRWYELFKICHQADEIPYAISLALEWMPRIRNVESVFLPIGTILHMNAMHDAAVTIYENILRCDPNARQTHSELLVHKQLSGLDEEDALMEFVRWNAQFVKPIAQAATRARTPRDPDRPLRIGFVSNDFGGDHSLNTAMAPWFLHKEHGLNTYLFYSNRPDDGADHKLFVDAADSFINIYGQSDEEVDRRIRSDEVDILVDMIGHSGNNRLLTYARMPAPIIVSWIGIGIPTGVETVDYFLADEIRVPRSSIGRYREKVVYLPGTAMAWCPPASASSVTPLPMLRNGHVVFGNLTRVVKIQRETVDLWAQVLRRVPESKFLMKDIKLIGHNERRIRSQFAAAGISSDRVICLAGTGQRDHLTVYNDIDIVLDCFPQQGGVSSLEAMWMGVPVVSYCHSIKPAGRVGRFLLENVGLSALATEHAVSYADIAVFLAGQREKLAAIRAGLRRRLAQSPLCDVPGFQRHVNAAFRIMWRRYCSGDAPASFTVQANG
jgi:predicted O-linked N-acetylglucosamine transferase (SPINDLY family)